MKRRTTTIIGFFCIVLLPIFKITAQTSSATWNLTSNGNASVSGNITAGALSKGPGARAGGISAMTYNSNGVSSTNWIGYTYSQFDITSSYYNKDYYQYTVSPSGGSNFTVNTISYTVSASTAPVSWYAYYSLDGFSTYTALGGLNATSHSGLNISVPAGSTFTLRIYGMDLVSTSTAFRNKSVVISGSSLVPCVPQTSHAGSSLTICKGSTSPALGGSVGGSATTGTWSSNSGGTFTPNASDLNATWTPPTEFTGTATLSLTTTNGCATAVTSNKTVTVNSVSLNNAITNTQNILAATEANAIYQWIRCDEGNAPIAGATSQSYTPQVSGSYAVKLAAAACPSVIATSTCITINRDNLGIPGTLQVSGMSEFEKKVTLREGLIIEGLETDTIAPSDSTTSPDFSFLVVKGTDGTVVKKNGLTLVDMVYQPMSCFALAEGQTMNPSWSNGPNKIYVACPDEARVGIGTSNPLSKLDVRGLTFTQQLAINIPPANMTGLFHLRTNGSSNSNTVFLVESPTKKLLELNNQGLLTTERIYIKNTTTDPSGSDYVLQIENSSQKLLQLQSNGLMRARKIRVDAETWADFVFDENYSLMSTEELRKFISVNRHLPNVPSAATVGEQGIDLAEMNKILLQKVEELTLYMLAQQKQLEEQQKQINELNKTN